MQKLWISETRKNYICVDSYENGVLTGWLHSSFDDGKRFMSLSQLLLALEEFLDTNHLPQAFNASRRFSEARSISPDRRTAFRRRRGKLATFEIAVLFRQNTSWQGLLKWTEKGTSQSFRSVLELIFLMDSALRAE